MVNTLLELLDAVIDSPFFWMFGVGFEVVLGVLASEHRIALRWLTGWTALMFAALCVHVYVRHIAKLHQRPSSEQWFEMEERFGMIDDELEGHWSVSDVHEVRWMAWRKSELSKSRREDDHGQRSTKRFEFEAMHAGHMLRRAGYVVSGFPVESGADDFDYWMSALASEVPRESGTTGSGYDGTRDVPIHTKSGHFNNVIHASKFLCAKMAREQS